ncbi:alpha/beta fold hydrolase [Paenibacillus daejeonensis]|uniref:alpha/beta fold hydrolase n=1 Tax=Paenibacillus daejeonensis TaxID=135193 RepID=UPI00036E5C3C|nr:alpha/beta fold hydrolase [Paenibacillus daejeonensis]
MKRLTASTLVLVMLLTALPAFAADSSIKVNIDGQTVTTQGGHAYTSGNDVMLPLRSIAVELGIKVAYEQATRTVSLTAPLLSTSFKVGGHTAVMGEQEMSFGHASVLRNDRVYVPLSYFTQVLRVAAEYDRAAGTVSLASRQLAPEMLAEHVVYLLSSGDHEQLWQDYFDPQVQQGIPLAALGTVWEQLETASGAYTAIRSIDAQQTGDSTSVAVILAFELAEMKLSLQFNTNHQITGISFQPVIADIETPEGLVEEKITVGAGTNYPLEGLLTLPENAEGPLPAVVLVHGSGPNDRNSAIGANAPFRDLAYGLAEQGIAVLRYDKRTYTHGRSYTPEEAALLTVKEETVDDAITAAELLKQDPRIDAAQVYVIGHSLGGMLAPRIDADGGDFAGLILLAGSPRPLWEIIYDQNADFIASMSDSDPAKAANEAWLEAELLRAQSIAEMSMEEAQATTVFGMSAHYFKEMDQFNLSQYADEATKPILVLQGEDDFQVKSETDYAAWKTLFDGKANATFKLYPGLNHLFIAYEGPAKGTVDEYKQPGNVSPTVLNDIAEWILNLE